MTTIRHALVDAAARLAGSDSSRLDAEVLLAHVLERPRSYLYTWPERTLTPAQAAAFEALVRRRAAGEPVAHLTGRREFWSLALQVTADTLIPRPETEVLVEQAVARLPAGGQARVADLGTGSGAVALALAHERPGWRVVGTDRSLPALEVARANARRLGLPNLDWVNGHWCAPFRPDCFDLIACNPPYVAEGDPHLLTADLPHEPRSALTAGPEGLDALGELIPGAWQCLRPGGWLLLEHGPTQGAAVRHLLEAAGFASPETHPDLGGRPRVTGALRPAC